MCFCPHMTLAFSGMLNTANIPITDENMRENENSKFHTYNLQNQLQKINNFKLK